jgi:NAD-dependent deacetylase
MIETAAAMLAEAMNPVSFSGAGLSAESGIATFREPQTGLWARHDPMKLASPQGFAADPELVIAWYNDRRRTLAAARPNAAHVALAARADMVHIAQNVDNLLERAGAQEVVHLHGFIDRDRCSNCSHREPVNLADPPGLRPCPECEEGLMRPDVVWFGESLPRLAWTHAQNAAEAADVFLVIGTSATVYPAAGLIEVARASGASLIVVNLERDTGPGIQLTGPAAEIVPRLLSPPTTGDGNG